MPNIRVGAFDTFVTKLRETGGNKCWPVQISHLDCNTTSLWKLQEMVAEVLHPVDVDPYI